MFDLTYYQKRREAIRKNKGTDVFCLSCFQANPLTTQNCLFCTDPPVGDRELALLKIDEAIETVKNRPPIQGHEWKGSVLPGYKRSTHVSDDEDVHVYIDDLLVFTGSPKRARRYLRSRGLSISNGHKEGTGWYLLSKG